MFFISLLLLQAASEPQPVKTVVTQQKLGSIDIPDAIGYPMSRYLTCRIMSNGTPLYAQGKLVAATVGKGADCTAVRKKAIEDSDKILDRTGMSKIDRMALIEKTVLEVEHMTASSDDANPVPPEAVVKD